MNRVLIFTLTVTITCCGCSDMNSDKNASEAANTDSVNSLSGNQHIGNGPREPVLPTDSISLERMILDSVHALKEVRDREEYVKTETAGTRHLQYSIAERPTTDNPYYLIKIMEDNGESYYTHFNFYVYGKPFQIKFYDPVTDSVLSLTEWRQNAENEGN